MMDVPMRTRLQFALVFPLVLWLPAALAFAQAPPDPGVRIVSEFQRIDPFGNIVPQDREFAPREILSPAIARNGHLSLHVVVTGPPGTNYFIYAGSNPPSYVEVSLYRESFVPCGGTWCPDWLTPEPSGSFGAIPEFMSDWPGETARVYLLDIWAPPSAPPGRVRVEAQVKVGTWLIAPMEVRVVDRMVPVRPLAVAEDVAPPEAPSSATAEAQLLRYSASLAPEAPAAILRYRDILQRNAAEDMALARSRSVDPFEFFPFSTGPRTFGPEWYLRVRDLIYR
jgi:hypothetical protein